MEYSFEKAQEMVRRAVSRPDGSILTSTLDYIKELIERMTKETAGDSGRELHKLGRTTLKSYKAMFGSERGQGCAATRRRNMEWRVA